MPPPSYLTTWNWSDRGDPAPFGVGRAVVLHDVADDREHLALRRGARVLVRRQPALEEVDDDVEPERAQPRPDRGDPWSLRLSGVADDEPVAGADHPGREDHVARFADPHGLRCRGAGIDPVDRRALAYGPDEGVLVELPERFEPDVE